MKSRLDHYDGGAGGNSIMAKTSRRGKIQWKIIQDVPFSRTNL